MSANAIKEITRDDLKALVRELMQEILWELEQEMPDPDEGLELRPEIAAYLDARLAENKWDGKPLDQVMRDLDLGE